MPPQNDLPERNQDFLKSQTPAGDDKGGRGGGGRSYDSSRAWSQLITPGPHSKASIRARPRGWLGCSAGAGQSPPLPPAVTAALPRFPSAQGDANSGPEQLSVAHSE